MREVITNAKAGMLAQFLYAASWPLSHLNTLLGLITAIAGCVLAVFSALNAFNAWCDRREQKRRARAMQEEIDRSWREHFSDPDREPPTT